MLSDLLEIVEQLKSSGSSLDIIPPFLFKQIFTDVAPYLLIIINRSLESGIMPDCLKHAVVYPLLKKQNLDSSVLTNFRPISNLPFISKILEKIVFSQLQSFLADNVMFETFQSGFRKCHSTETALLKVLNYILISCDSGDFAVLVLLDLTAAFDTVDHAILIDRLEHCIGLRGIALDWFKSYFANRSFSVKMGEHYSRNAFLPCGVPQGSILAPLLFSLYMLPLGSIFRKHGLSFHCYADDTQVYLPVKRNAVGFESLMACLADVKAWLS